MIKALIISSLASLVLLTGGCRSPDGIPDYRTSRDSLTYLHQSGARAIALGPFTGQELERPYVDTCFDRRALPGADDFSYVTYIRDAFADELRIAGRLSQSPEAQVLSGNVDRIAVVRTGPWSASWRIRLSLATADGRTMTVEDRYKFDTRGVLGPGLCVNAAKALAPAVREVLETAIASREFRSLVG